MHLARAFERRANAMMSAIGQRGARPPQRPGLLTPPWPLAVVPAAPARPFCRLSPAKQLEHHRQGLCYNCDEPYVCGHVCPWLFYLESADFLDDEVLAEVVAVVVF
jgi:hypothetical protein